MLSDSCETENLVEKRPDILTQLRMEYIRWFSDVSNTRPDNYLSPRIQIDPDFENPVVLTRQDREHFKGNPFG